ncbi:glycosyltransferase family 2 protein [Marinimicrococcus flavescens]|uniref:Glycosyltransferase n=1 Tax=Marinimicrococcus flavescens TaxID=3031815 RepID=A0AAP3XR93_9PROT|nr:glycosyltransferase [Marinimicrococcus flavescens]
MSLHEPAPRWRAATGIGVVVVTHRARRHLRRCLPPLLASPLRPRVLVVDSCSDDGTAELARSMGAEVFSVLRRDLNHGLTREHARRILGTPVVAMLSPDAYPQDAAFLEKLAAPVLEGRAAVSYGRQVAAADADLPARFARSFNYPATSQLRGLEDWPQYGSYTHFCSDACAAWSSEALDGIGGFPATLVSEETIAAARLLRAGHKIAYVAEAVVEHTHATRLLDSFRRQFDVGYTRTLFAGELLEREGDEPRGRRYALELVRAALAERPSALPLALADTALRWLGYRIGRRGPALPRGLARRLSGQDFYWLDPAPDSAAPAPAW